MNTHSNMEERLWDYIDGLASAEEKNFIEELIASQEEWRAKYQELLGVHEVMAQSLELDEPSMRFSQNVMEEIARLQIAPAAKTYINKKIIFGFAAFFLTTIAALFGYGLSQVNWTQKTPDGILSNVTVDKVDWSILFNNNFTNIFLMVNLILGLVLLDMYLGRKRKALREGNV